MIEILVNTQATLDMIFSAGYTDAVNPSVTITDQDGATVSTGTSTKDNTVTGRYTYVLPPQTQLMWLVATWTGVWGGVTMSISTGAGQNDGTPAEIQVAGGHLFTIRELRAFGDAALSNTTTYPDETLIDIRSRVTVLFEDYCDVAFVNRYGRYTTAGGWDNPLWLPDKKLNRIRSVTVDGVALGAGDLAQLVVDPDGAVYRNGYWGFWSGMTPQNIVVSYEHGWTATPEPIARAAMILARYEATMTNQLADRMITMQNEFGIIRQALPGPNSPTGIPIVDATLNRYRETVMVA